MGGKGIERGRGQSVNEHERRSMKRIIFPILGLIITVAIASPSYCKDKPSRGSYDYLIITGSVRNPQGKGLKEVSAAIFADGKEVHLRDELATDEGGNFQAILSFPKGKLPEAKVEVELSKPAYKSSGRVAFEHIVKDHIDEKGNTYYLSHIDLILQRAVTPGFWIAMIVLLGVYVLIAFEFFHRTLAALLGAALMLLITYAVGTFYPDYYILSFEDAIGAIDMNVIFLLMAMMIIVGVMKRTGVFQWLALKSFEFSKGSVFALSAILMFVTAVASAFLDNVTTMLLMTPVTIEICRALKLNPLSLMLPEVFASNVGGTATLIGDPPNIMIGSYAKLSFVDFVNNLTIICLIGLAAAILYYLWYFRKDYVKAEVADVKEMARKLREDYKITDMKLLKMCLVILGITILLFIIHGTLHMEPSIAALMGAGALLVVSRVNIVEMLEHEIEWPTLIFFMMLFVVVAGAEQTGLIQVIADWVADMSKGSLVIAVVMILWVSAIASAFIDNIPFTATMLPIVAYLNQVIPGAESGILWWSLALGACLGGNGTMIGASANVVTVGIAESLGYRISFMTYMRMAWWPMIITCALGMGWLLIVMM
jgi:Na+/H+ antiporter NhaD/arsenite permease-like protein